jgi:hypothetical protein
MAPALRVDPLGWLGKSISIYFDNDDAWFEKLSKLKKDEEEGKDDSFAFRTTVPLRSRLHHVSGLVHPHGRSALRQAR